MREKPISVCMEGFPQEESKRQIIIFFMEQRYFIIGETALPPLLLRAAIVFTYSKVRRIIMNRTITRLNLRTEKSIGLQKSINFLTKFIFFSLRARPILRSIILKMNPHGKTIGQKI